MSYLRLPICTVIVALLGGLARSTYAHDPGLSVARLRLVDNQIAVHLTFARRDIESLVRIDTDHDGALLATELASAGRQLRRLARDALALRVDDQHLVAQVDTVQFDQSDAAHFRLTFARPPGAQLWVSVPILAQLPHGHRQYMVIQDATETSTTHLLDAEHAVFTLTLTTTPVVAQASLSFRQFLRLGMEHIMRGYDHMLFLFGLLVVGSSLASAWRIITSFTVAHSITLALATLNIVQLSPRLVELLIAISIVYIGLENLWHRPLKHRWLLTFGFGLVHGFGFAAVLHDLGLGRPPGSEVVMPLLAFNLGVELGQMAIALVILPVLWQVQRLPYFFPHFTTICSVLVLLAGTYWLVERTMSH